MSSREIEAVIPFSMSAKEVALVLTQAGYPAKQVCEQRISDTYPLLNICRVHFPDFPDLDQESPLSMCVTTSDYLANVAAQLPHSESGTLISCWYGDGTSETIFRTLLDRTGGWLRSDDGSSEWEMIVPTSKRTPDEVRSDRTQLLGEAALEAVLRSIGDMGVTPMDDEANDLRTRLVSALSGASCIAESDTAIPSRPR